jgi:uncharacterized protein (TIGR02466 family)
MTVRDLFPTRICETTLAGQKGFEALLADLEAACRMLEAEDVAGRDWCRKNGYGGYTSYASLDDLPRRASVFDDLRRRLDRLVTAYARDLNLELGAGRLKLDSLWVNILKPGAGHSGHIHPHSAISGTMYVATPPGASALRLEDPRLPLMMAAPPRRTDAPEAERTFVSLAPSPGTVFLWESWLRHEVPPNRARTPRISISFNYAWS